MGYEEIYTRKTNTAMILSAGHSMPVVLRLRDTPEQKISINMHMDNGSKKLWLAYGLLICSHGYLHNL